MHAITYDSDVNLIVLAGAGFPFTDASSSSWWGSDVADVDPVHRA